MFSNILTIILAALVAGAFVPDAATADTAPCTTCEKPKELSLREQIKADRDKYDRENLNTTGRPWDGMNLGRIPNERKAPADR
jgi:hypothetical protein